MRTVEQRLQFIEYRLVELASLIAQILSNEPEVQLQATYPTRFEQAIHTLNTIDAFIKQSNTFDEE